ncbi:ABC transporter ATP-binding protein [Kribbella sp. NPDC056861]|uniref:ABC transporter ATP-binding protein n=1 Tax=Kribbella sp. NPDC056861 TaxID=3154857 RepID=UPI00342948CF
MTPAVRLRALSKTFGALTAVDGVDLDVARGEFLTLLGPSGCGKTSILRMIAGLLPPTSGQVWIGDADMTRLPAHRRPVCTVFQDYALFPHLDVAGNVSFGLRERGIRGQAARDRIDAVLDQVGLLGRRRARPDQLSGGQRQRVALARSLVLRPDVLLLDEPLGALDLALRKQLQILLRQLQRDSGITFVHVTHDQTEAFAISDRVAVLNTGRVDQIDTPVSVYRHPATRFVASFVGEVNRLPAVIVQADSDCYEVRLAEGQLISVPGAPGLAPGTEVEVLIRPEDLHPARLAPQSLVATITALTFGGAGTTLTLESGTGDPLTATLPAREAELFVPGSRVRLGWQPSETWLIRRPRTDG